MVAAQPGPERRAKSASRAPRPRGADATQQALDPATPVEPQDRPVRRTDQAEALQRFKQWRETGDYRLRNALVLEHRWVAVHCARRFAGRGEPLDDLIQVAQLGVLKAVQRFDPSLGVAFATFAMPTVLGELRRHFRDQTWSVRVPRRAKELHLELSAALERLIQELGRAPRVAEIAAAVQFTEEEVLEALEAGAAYRSVPLAPVHPEHDEDQPADGITLGTLDAGLETADGRVLVDEVMASLPARERLIVELRFYRGLTQSEIASIVGLSQVHVSRLLRTSLEALRQRLSALGASDALAEARGA